MLPTVPTPSDEATAKWPSTVQFGALVQPANGGLAPAADLLGLLGFRLHYSDREDPAAQFMIVSNAFVAPQLVGPDPGCLEKRPRVTPQKLPRTKLPGACSTPSVGCPLRVVACGSRAKPHPKRSTSPRLRPPAQTARTARPTTATSMLRLALRSPCSPNERRTTSVAPFPTSRALTKFSAQRRPASHQRQVPPTGVPPSPPRLRAHQPRRVASRTLHRDATVPGDRLLVGSHSAPGPPLFAPYAVANDALARSLVSAALVPPLRPSAAKRALPALVRSESTLLGDVKRRQQAAVVIVVGARH